ncbi:MAG: amino acid carrier protein [Lachnospiraceae bacterium]|nr:amino acid carrier protein [Lachnospiraceae bacterium]
MHFVNHFLWNAPIIFLLFGTHLYFTFRLGFIQKMLPKAIRLSLSAKESSAKGISPLASLATALAATLGTGNIIGISTAISIGGPGAVFWCWLTGLFGIATCYAESFLAVKFRKTDAIKGYTGGPMYVLENALHMKKLAKAFAFFTLFASFGIGSSVQANSIRCGIQELYNLSSHWIGITASLLAGTVMLGGIRQISRVCTKLVPFMSLFYLTGCGYLLILNRKYLFSALCLITQSAFSSKSLAGGIAGTNVIIALRTGISKGLFTNEAGLGSIPIMAAATSSPSPVKQGLVSMTGPFWDTVVMCSITGIVIVSSMLHFPADFTALSSDRLCFAAFSHLPAFGIQILSISLILFAFSTILGWCYYGECCIDYLFHGKGTKLYQIIYIVFIYLGAVMSLSFVWELSDLLNLLMAIPNLLCIWLLQREITTKDLAL